MGCLPAAKKNLRMCAKPRTAASTQLISRRLTVLILLNAPTPINAPVSFPKKKYYINLHEFLFASLNDVAL